MDARSLPRKVRKERAKARLARAQSEACNLGLVYATRNGDVPLRRLVDLSYSDLKRAKDEALPAIARAAVRALRTVEARLVSDYGMADGKLAAIEALLGTYEEHKPLPRTKIADGQVINANIKNGLKTLDHLLSEQLDRLVAGRAARHPDFVQQYRSWRVIVDAPTRKRSPANA